MRTNISLVTPLYCPFFSVSFQLELFHKKRLLLKKPEYFWPCSYRYKTFNKWFMNSYFQEFCSEEKKPSKGSACVFQTFCFSSLAILLKPFILSFSFPWWALEPARAHGCTQVHTTTCVHPKQENKGVGKQLHTAHQSFQGHVEERSFRLRE